MMNKKHKLLLMFPFYLVSVIFSFIVALPISFLHIILQKSYFNPIKLGWYYFNGKKYEFDEMIDREVAYLMSPISFFFFVVLIVLMCLLWKYVFIITLFVLFIICAFYFAKKVSNELFGE